MDPHQGPDVLSNQLEGGSHVLYVVETNMAADEVSDPSAGFFMGGAAGGSEAQPDAG